MSAGTITALCAGVAGILTAITALIHSVRTRKQVSSGGR